MMLTALLVLLLQTPVVPVDVATCRLTVTQTPQDTTSGGQVRFIVACDGEAPLPPPSPPPPPSTTWTVCAWENEPCPFTGTREVRYGLDPTFVILTRTNGTPCTNAVFGDPLVGTRKQCAYGPLLASPPPPSTGLTPSGSITARAGQVIENLRVTGTITVNGAANVIIRNVEVLHNGVAGIRCNGSSHLTLDHVALRNTGAPAQGATTNSGAVNVTAYNCPDLRATNVRVRSGSSGFHILESPRAYLNWIECHDARGPFPRGQCVQFDKSSDSVLEDFSYEQVVGVSWEEDNISVYRSSNVIIRRGLIRGNNSPSGIGVMFEQDDGTSSGGLVEDVDAIRMGNGAFSGYPARGVTFRRTRARDNLCTSQDGRGVPMSNALVWAGSPDSANNLRIEQGTYFNLCNPGNLVWDRSRFAVVDIAGAAFTPRAPIRVRFAWEP